MRRAAAAATGQDRLNGAQVSPMHLSRTAWLLLGILECVAWILNAVVEGSSTLAIIIGPLLVLLWVAAVLVVDRWATKGTNQSE
jgi:hypothetical protein